MKSYEKKMLSSNYKAWLNTPCNNIYNVYGRCSEEKKSSYAYLQRRYAMLYDGHHSKITSHNTFRYTLATTALKDKEDGTTDYYFIVDTAMYTYICGLDYLHKRLFDLETGEIFYEA